MTSKAQWVWAMNDATRPTSPNEPLTETVKRLDAWLAPQQPPHKRSYHAVTQATVYDGPTLDGAIAREVFEYGIEDTAVMAQRLRVFLAENLYIVKGARVISQTRFDGSHAHPGYYV